MRTTGAVCVEAGWSKPRLLELVKELDIKGQNWPKKTKVQICDLIRMDLRNKGLLRRGKCGTSRKVK